MLCTFRSTVTASWMAPLPLLLLFHSYKLFGFWFSSLLFTSLAVLLSTAVYMWKQHKTVAVHKSVEVEENASSMSVINAKESKEIHGIDAKESKEEQGSVSDDEDDEDGASQEPVLSTSEDYDMDHMPEFSDGSLLLSTSEDYGMDHTPEFSDGSISDEESLIEIALPSGHSVGQQKKEGLKKKSELTAEALFNQQSLMEFLAEFNEMNIEEENLIEIDISMGSIKYSSFEIEPQQAVLKV